MAPTLRILHFPHPALRYEAKSVKRVDAELRHIIQNMFRLMYEAQGVGLAAPQVGIPLRLFVANLKSDPQEGEELVFINPVLSRAKGTDEAEEGCLSLPGLYGQVARPKQVRVTAYNLAGEEVQADATGLFARVVQHECDHLNGVLFIDRMTEEERNLLTEKLVEMQSDYEQACATGDVATQELIGEQLGAWERRYC